MMKLWQILLGAAALGCALPAHAAYVEANFSGQILYVVPGAPAAVVLGAPVTFSATFNPDNLVDHTASINDATGLGFASVFTASLSDDPIASLKINVGGITFTKFDEVNYHTPEGDCGMGCDLGAGNFPTVTYLNGSFAGIGNMFINGDGYVFDADPIADAFGGFDGFQFILNQGTVDNPFQQVLALGNYDAADVTFRAVPEPAAWSLMVLGFGALGAMLRRRGGPRAQTRLPPPSTRTIWPVT